MNELKDFRLFFFFTKLDQLHQYLLNHKSGIAISGSKQTHDMIIIVYCLGNSAGSCYGPGVHHVSKLICLIINYIVNNVRFTNCIFEKNH